MYLNRELHLPNLATNPNWNAIKFLEMHPDKIYWIFLCCNHNAYNLLKNYTLNMNYHDFSYFFKFMSINSNPKILQLMTVHKNNPTFWDKVDKWDLSTNYAAIDLLLSNPDKIRWDAFCCNTHPLAIDYIDANIDKIMDFITWDYLSANRAAIHILLKYPEKINIEYLCQNTNPIAIQYVLTLSSDKIYWNKLAENPAAIYLIIKKQEFFNKYYNNLCNNPHPYIINILKQNFLKYKYGISYFNLCSNPLIFEDKYKIIIIGYFMKYISQELIAYIWNPSYLKKHAWLWDT